MKSEHYTAAGVDIDAADALIDRIKPLAASTRIEGASGGLGGFGGVFDLAAAGYGEGAPRLVSGTDGVGTKLKVAFATGVHDTIGIDCVAMCVNDILVAGARPLFFLDYFATGRLRPEVGAAVVQGIAEGCRQAGCWLAGGETAEMPGMYADGEYDLAGFVVGALGPGDERDPGAAAPGQLVIGVGSSGLHSNGFSLARRVLLDGDNAPGLEAHLPGDELTVGRRMLVPTRIYARALQALREAELDPVACAHITGGGLWENPQRSVHGGVAFRFHLDALRTLRQPLYREISALGGIPETEMYRVFNMGVGLTLVCDADRADATLACLRASGESAEIIGELVDRDSNAVELPGISEAAIP